MSDSVGGKPAVPRKYLEAVANQKAGIVNTGPLRSFRFLARRPDGIEFIFWVKAHDSAGAADLAAVYCAHHGYHDCGRVVGNRSAFDCAAAEATHRLGTKQ